MIDNDIRERFPDEQSLVQYATRLEGKRISDISNLIGLLDVDSRSRTKAIVSNVVETHYFGIPTNSYEAPDFPHLGIELKVSPLKYVSSAALYNCKERNVLKVMDYHDVFEHPDWREAKLAHKLNKILFVFYIHDNEVPAIEWKIATVFLWSPSPEETQMIEEDYNIIRNKIIAGERNREGHNTLLGTCPKHAGGYKYQNPSASVESALRPHPVMKYAEKRGFCLKQDKLIFLIANVLDYKIKQVGRTKGLPAEAFPGLQ